MLRMDRLHLHRNPNHPVSRRTEHVPAPLIFHVIQKIFLLIHFELQFCFSPFYLLRFGLLRALSASASKKSCFHPKPFLGPLTLCADFETSARNFGSNQMEFSPNFLFTTGSSSTRNSVNPYRSNPRTRNFRFRQKRNSSPVRISGSSLYLGSFKSEGMSATNTRSPIRKPCRRS